MYQDFPKFEQSQLLHLLIYIPENCTDLSKGGYLHCVKILSKNSLIYIFDDVIANQYNNPLIGKDTSHGRNVFER